MVVRDVSFEKKSFFLGSNMLRHFLTDRRELFRSCWPYVDVILCISFERNWRTFEEEDTYGISHNRSLIWAPPKTFYIVSNLFDKVAIIPSFYSSHFYVQTTKSNFYLLVRKSFKSLLRLTVYIILIFPFDRNLCYFLCQQAWTPKFKHSYTKQ